MESKEKALFEATRHLRSDISEVNKYINRDPNYSLDDRLFFAWLSGNVFEESEKKAALLQMSTQEAADYVTKLVADLLNDEKGSKFAIITTSEYIGQGTYGCIYSPPGCIDKKYNKLYSNNQYVMKLTNNKSGNREFEISIKLKQLDPKQEYFIYSIVKCEPDIRYIPYRCDSFNPLDMSALILLNGGIQIDNSKSKYFIKYNTYDFPNKIYFQLFEALYILEKAKIYHNDIAFRNILVNNKNQVRIIDFGEAIFDNHSKNIEKWLKEREEESELLFLDDPDKNPYPLFLAIYFHDIEDNKEYYIHYESSLKRYNKKYIRGGKGDLIHKWSKLSRKEIMDTLILPNLFKIDIYILSKLLYSGVSDKYLLYKCLDPDPSKQLSPSQAMEYMYPFEKYVNSDIRKIIMNFT